jgi:ribonuclease P protein component
VSSFSFTKEDRLLEASSYSNVFDQVDVKASHKNLLLLASNNNLEHDRLGLIIAKKYVRLAVQRNRIKRIVREFFRNHPSGSASLDIVVLARKGVDQLDNASLSSILRQQWQKLEK